MQFKIKYNPLNKILNFFLRKALHFKRDKFFNDGMPSYVGLINEYISLEIMVDGVYDFRSINEIKQLLESNFLNFKCETLLDIGANIGNHSLYFSKYFKNIISFEPNPFTFEILKINTSHYPNVSINNFGLSTKKDLLYMSEDKRNLGGSKIYHNKEDIPSNLLVKEVYLKQLDSLNIKASTNSVLIKLDVEGHEIYVLRGAINFIKAYNPVICFEQHTNDFSEGKSAVIEFLDGLGYEFYLFKSIYDSYKSNFIKILFKLMMGDKYELKKISSFKPDFYDSIISIHPDTLN